MKNINHPVNHDAATFADNLDVLGDCSGVDARGVSMRCAVKFALGGWLGDADALLDVS